MHTTRWFCLSTVSCPSFSIILRQTVDFPEAVPPATPMRKGVFLEVAFEENAEEEEDELLLANPEEVKKCPSMISRQEMSVCLDWFTFSSRWWSGSRRTVHRWFCCSNTGKNRWRSEEVSEKRVESSSHQSLQCLLSFVSVLVIIDLLDQPLWLPRCQAGVDK